MAFTLRCVEFISIPGVGPLDRPVSIFVFVALVTSIRNVQFFGKLRVGHVKAVVTPMVTAHVSGLGHVAVDTGMARANVIVFAKSEVMRVL